MRIKYCLENEEKDVANLKFKIISYLLIYQFY